MATEFGDIDGVFEGDEVTAAFIAKRKNPAHKNSVLYFRADPDAVYAETHIIDLSKVDSLVASYPPPDDVAPPKIPSIGGKRRVTPGSLPIIAKLHRLGLVKFYEQAGFEIRTPRCSYEGEIWLSSQN
ncbi:hypothetical protein Glove_29g146 [Diversispora epigaea]|uniref:Uncharacterized protein n=1 Tax=Diversispora epigaea TaxID=1348612 RepID=A0A397JHP7_9GLOM|nr:hypothetical protein Glove_29g146 [Diversispora epigaea]